jgi:carbon-monoxide dehydrogenase small subunit
MSMGGSVPLTTQVNGVVHEQQVEPRLLLVDFLRRDLALTGTHSGCDDGLCGACTVLVDGEPLKNCLLLAVQVDGCEITTVEGLGGPDSLHPLQRAFVDCEAVQCGYCTAGFVVAGSALLQRDPQPTDEAVRLGLIGNLCRCGCYQNIRKAIRRVAENNAEPHLLADGDAGAVPEVGSDR